MNKYDKNKKMVSVAFIAGCVLTLAFIISQPKSPMGSYLVLACLLSGYFVYMYRKKMTVVSATFEKKNRSPLKERRRRLLEKEQGKVLEFPKVPDVQPPNDTKD